MNPTAGDLLWMVLSAPTGRSHTAKLFRSLQPRAGTMSSPKKIAIVGFAGKDYAHRHFEKCAEAFPKYAPDPSDSKLWRLDDRGAS